MANSACLQNGPCEKERKSSLLTESGSQMRTSLGGSPQNKFCGGAGESSRRRTDGEKMTSSLLVYIVTINSLERGSAGVRSTDVAVKLGVARASVCKAADRLAEGGWVVRGEGSRLHLTEKGRAVAEDCAPARRLIGRMFSEKLGLSAARADREALAVLGALEEDTVKRIARLGRGKERE